MISRSQFHTERGASRRAICKSRTASAWSSSLKRLDKAIDNKKDSKFAEISNELGLNVFLSEKINSKTLKELSSAIKSIPNSFNYSDSIFVSSYDFGGFSSFDSSFDSFDFGGGDFGGGGDGGSWD